MQTNQLHTDFQKTTTELLQVADSFKQEQLNTIPFAGSWTAGQVLQHLVMANSGFAELINGPVANTERQPDSLVAGIKESFLDFTIKMESPDFVRPPFIDYNKSDLVLALKSAMQSIDKSITSLDLSQTCTAFEIPVSGYLTRLEAIYFVIYHTQRHIHQLKNIAKKLELQVVY